MEASFATTHRHITCKGLSADLSRFGLKLPIRSVSYGRRRCSQLPLSMAGVKLTEGEPNKSREVAVESWQTPAEMKENLHAKSSPVEVVIQPKRAAKIHDFCLGIPFGGLVLSGGLAGFLFSRNPTTLLNGLLFGGALLALSSYSLKVWRQGKSCLPFMLGQAALAATLVWKQLHLYTLTKKLFPTGLFAIVSAAMLCFYTYVMVSGGNPPPKKLRSAMNSSP